MAEQQENRRIRMTKRMIKEALLELLEQRDLVNISVTAICEAADVHRSTFYKHYRDQADLLRDLEQDYLDRVPTPAKELGQLDEEELLLETTAFFDYVKDNERTFRILFGESTSSDFTTRLIDLLCTKYADPSKGDDVASYYAHLYIANGTVGILRKWINSGFPVSSREMAKMMYLFSVRVAP